MQVSPPPSLSRQRRRPDYYAALCVGQDASICDIEVAYWQRAAQRGAGVDMALLNEAYEVLGSAERREAYDAELSGAPAPPRKAPVEPNRPGTPGLRRKLQWFLQ